MSMVITDKYKRQIKAGNNIMNDLSILISIRPKSEQSEFSPTILIKVAIVYNDIWDIVNQRRRALNEEKRI